MDAATSPSPETADPDRAKVFVSYSRKDLTFAEQLVAALNGRGYDAFLDLVDIAPGEPWQERLAGLIAAADSVVFAISPDSVASKVCIWELHESERLGKRVIPVVSRRIEVVDAPAVLARLNWVFATKPDEFQAAVETLGSTLDTDIDWVREHTRIGERARRWEANGRSAAETLRGAALEAAERWLALQPKSANAPTELHRVYIAASRRAATRRQRVFVAGALLVALVALGLAALAEVNRREAQVQRDRAEHTLALATDTANGLVFDLAQTFRTLGVPAATIKDIIERARKLQDQLTASGEQGPLLRASRAEALMEAAETLLTLGDTHGSRGLAEEARDIFRSLSAAEPANNAYRRELAISETKIGDTLQADGDLDGALRSFRASLSIMLALVQKADDDVTWIRDLATSNERVGDVLKTQGRLDDALAAYRESLTFRSLVAKSFPDDLRVQRDLSISHQRIGNVLFAQDKTEEALAAYREEFAITQRLAAKAPNNTEAQRDMALSQGSIGDALKRLGRFDEAIAAFRASLAIVEALAAKDPDNTEWRRDVLAGGNRIGDLLFAQKKFDEALVPYREGLQTAQALAAIDPGNTTWQRDLSIAHNKIAEVLRVQRRFDEALDEYRRALAIRKALTAKDPANTLWQGDLAWCDDRIGEVLDAADRQPEAIVAWQEARGIREMLARKDASNVTWQLDLVRTLDHLAVAGIDAEANCTAALAILKRLDAAGLLSADRKHWIATIEADLAAAKSPAAQSP